jgi:hypothetical protein
VKRKRRIIWIVSIVVVIIGIQLIPLKRPDVREDNPDDLLISADVPDNVARLLKVSCYDCHSNQTAYPWYSNVAPASWLVVRDIRLGRERMNFSTWNSFEKSKKAGMLSGIIDEVSAKDMPMSVYVIMHPEARLEEADRGAIVDWANAYGERLFN